MELKKSKQSRRIGVIANFKSIIGIVLLFEIINSGLLPKRLLIFELIPVFFLLCSYIIFFGKTGLWKFTHKPTQMLDEREIQITNRALRFSYIFFTIFSLSLFVVYNVLNIKINMVLVTSLIYTAHILPAYYISWTEERTIHDNLEND